MTSEFLTKISFFRLFSFRSLLNYLSSEENFNNNFLWTISPTLTFSNKILCTNFEQGEWLLFEQKICWAKMWVSNCRNEASHVSRESYFLHFITEIYRFWDVSGCFLTFWDNHCSLFGSEKGSLSNDTSLYFNLLFNVKLVAINLKLNQQKYWMAWHILMDRELSVGLWYKGWPSACPREKNKSNQIEVIIYQTYPTTKNDCGHPGTEIHFTNVVQEASLTKAVVYKKFLVSTGFEWRKMVS